MGTINWDDLFTLRRETGILYWKINTANHIQAGSPAGRVSSKGYMQVGYKRKQYYNHRIIWEMIYGAIPKGMFVDHINCVSVDNRPSNLRLATNTQNQHNSKVSGKNKSGVKGISYRRTSPKGSSKVYEYWMAAVVRNRKAIHKLFPYTDAGKLEAVNWVQSTREQLHAKFANHG